MKLFSYVVDHDTGEAPNPFHGYCTLALCKYASPDSNRRNLIEMVKEFFSEKGEEVWILGTGGVKKESSGHGTITYIMKVNEVLTLKDYNKDKRFAAKKYKAKGNEIEKMGDWGTSFRKNKFGLERYALISKEFYYFGNKKEKIPSYYIINGIEKKGVRHKYSFKKMNGDRLDEKFINYIENKYGKEYGRKGFPCSMSNECKEKVKPCKSNCN